MSSAKRCPEIRWFVCVSLLFSARFAIAQQGTNSNSPSQTIPLRQTSTPILAGANITYLDKCSCGDGQRLKDRLEKLKGAALLVASQLQSTPADKAASQQQWNALQSQIKGYLRAMQMQNLTSFPDDSLFLGNDDPFCGPQKVDAGVCLNQDFAVHQLEHDASYRAGNWTWQTPWAEKDMLLEEGNTIENEMRVIKETINRLGCDTPKVCPQFGIVVQNVTTSSVNIPGALAGGSARSLNNGQGISEPLTFHQDGSFEGLGSGSDAGSAAGATPNEAVGGQFGHSQSIAASGYIRPAGCNAQGCQDVMHLVLVGGPSSQMRQMQARGVINRDINSSTPTNAATMEFDLPAYVGGSAQKTFFSTPILNSYMTVNLVQGSNGTPPLPVGSSLLYSLQQCKLGAPAPAGGGGATGVVIPGLEKVPASPLKPTGASVPKQEGAGVVIPGLEGVPTTPTSKPAPASSNSNIGLVIPGLENGTSANTVPGPREGNAPPPSVPATNLKVTISESLQLADAAVPPAPHIAVNVTESLQVADVAVPPTPHLVVNVNESLQMSDTQSPLIAPAVVNVSETIQVSDNPVPPAVISLNESIQVSDIGSPTPVKPKVPNKSDVLTGPR